MSIEDLKKSKEMWVWDRCYENKAKANVVHIYEDGRCITDDFCYLSHCEEIKEPTYRPYTKDDDLYNLLCLKIRSKLDSSTVHIISGVTSTGLSIHGEWHDFITAFQEWEHIDGTPLGVKNKIDEKANDLSWKKGDKVRNIRTFNTVVFNKYSADGKYFYHEENNKSLKTELYRKC
jgi:hypothetical protein